MKYEVGGKFKDRFSTYTIRSLSSAGMVLQTGGAVLGPYPLDFLDYDLATGGMTYSPPAQQAAAVHSMHGLTPAAMQAVAASVADSIYDAQEAGVRLPKPAPVNVEELVYPKVYCLVCERELRGSFMPRTYSALKAGVYEMIAECCGKSERRTWDRAFVEKINASGGKWVAFLSN